ncbi:MAG: bacillithiol system redox-active protein YtxJ [Candidatus Hydrogenedentes bacterium]|nr:bacillithiol system redox-active protein YtxJ [Candidatus Hydrogenedentota bacterium]
MLEMSSMEDWQACLAVSSQNPVLVFKHSTQCPISAGARKGLIEYLAHGGPTILPAYEVLVIESRPVSNAIAESLGVAHKSPQLFLVHKGKAVWSASHYGINRDAIADAVKQLITKEE